MTALLKLSDQLKALWLEAEIATKATTDDMLEILSSWLDLPLDPMDIHIIGVKDFHDMMNNTNHIGVPELVNEISQTLVQYSVSWARRQAHQGKDRFLNFNVDHVFHPSLEDESGNSIFSNMIQKPTVALFLTHATKGPPGSGYLEDLETNGSGWIYAEKAASELSSLPGRNLLVGLPVCDARTVSRPFTESDTLGSVYAPWDGDLGETLLPRLHRILSSEIRKLDHVSILQNWEVNHAEA